MELFFPYGNTDMAAQIPDNRLLRVFRSKLEDYKPSGSERELVTDSMRNPIGSLTLAELAKGKRKVVLLASDHTRPVPSKIIIPYMLEEIRRGNPDADISVLIATGCHRDTTKKELISKFGNEICQTERIFIHDCNDTDNLVKLDTLPSGGDLTINRMAAQADLLIAEGFIEPHFFAGFSGGRKSVLPGIASREAVYYNHNAAFIDHPNSRAGVLEGNLIHRDMIFAAKRANLAYIVNVVLNSEKKIIASFAGDCDLAHKAGTDFLRSMVAEAPSPADIVITTNNGYPLDQNAYQAVKGMCTAEATCKPGGVIISVARCEDGCGGAEFYNTFRDNRSAEHVLETLRQRPPADTVEDQWQSQIFARILSKHTVVLVSDLPYDIVRDMHMIPARTVEEAICQADKVLQKKNAEICVILEGITTMII